MTPVQASDGSELEFFGVKLKVKNPHLAALLNSDVNEDVQVIGRRAREAFRRRRGESRGAATWPRACSTRTTP